MSKRKYRATDVKEVTVEGLLSRLVGDRVVVGIDVAKHNMFAAIMDEAGQVHLTVKWRHPDETPLFQACLEAIRDLGATVEVAMEPSGVYGDALRFQLVAAGFETFRVSPKRTHDAAEVYDGVPSLHDGKSSAIIAKLHLDRRSERWPVRSNHERQLDAALRVAEVFTKQFGQNRNRMEALTARHWPELGELLELGSATLLELLGEYGGPGAVARDEQNARKLMKRVGRSLELEKIAEVLASAHTTLGQPMIEEEVSLVRELARETRRNQKQMQGAVARLEELTEHEGSVREMRAVVGKKTAAVIVAAAGDPRNYPSVAAFVKALGLNLKENSSGESKKGGLHITKRGPGIARMVLYMAVLRMVQTDTVVQAWYAKKVGRMGGQSKLKAVVALMRKLAGALWNVARGARFDTQKLFNLEKLGLTSPAATAANPQ